MFSSQRCTNFFTICGYLWSLLDYGTDIRVGVDYHNKCHFKWAITTFIISFMPNIVFFIWIIIKSDELFMGKITWKSWWDWAKGVILVIFTILIILPILAVLLPIIQGYFVYKVLKKRKNEQNDVVQNSNDLTTQLSQSQDPEWIVKRFKTLTMFCESIPQLIFTSYCYFRAFHGNEENKGWIQLASMVISFINIVFGLHNRHRFFHRHTQKIKYCGIGTLKRILVLIMDISLKLSVVMLSVILFGIEVTLVFTFLFTILLMMPNYVYFYKYKKRNWFWYSVEILHLILTNLSFEMDFERDSTSFKLKEITNRTSLYLIFLFGLCGTTWNLHINGHNVLVNDMVATNTTSINSTLNCENLCNTLDLDCSKYALTLTNVKIWNYINWGIFALCCILLLKDVWKIHRKIQNLTITANALTQEELTALKTTNIQQDACEIIA